MCLADPGRLRLWLVAAALTLLALPAAGREAELVEFDRSRAADCLPPEYDRDWPAIPEDGLHDPNSPSAQVLQPPAVALEPLPPDTAGNLVDWIQAYQEGAIEPRPRRSGSGEIRTRDTNILMKTTGSAAYVLFPHRPHTQWLACENCHDAMFRREVGTTPFTMLDILQGRSCGRCHGAVAFPLTECNRCHSVSPETELPIAFCPDAVPAPD